MSLHIETVIIGGGQAGLAVSYYLSQQDRPHIVLEQAAQAGNAWRNHRWDSFTLNTPNWQSCLPGAKIPGEDADGFLLRGEIVAYFEEYVERFHLPVSYGVRVEGVLPKLSGRGYVVETSAGRFEADNVVIATGLYQKPKLPSLGADFPQEVKQVHSDKYRNPQSLPEGSVLVVGSGQSGAQIAEELYQSGRKVYLSVSRAGRVPLRYRGKDANWWQHKMGAYDRTVDQLPSPQAKFASKPQISGKDGGHTINFHQFALSTKCNQFVFGFHPIKHREIRAQFDGGAITTEGGGLLLREVEKRIGIVRQFAACFRDYRNPDLIEHTVEELVAQRVYGLALGYEDLNDHEELRKDPLLAVLVEKSDPEGEPLAGKSTLNRLELTPETANAKARYKKIVADHAAVDRLFVDVFLAAHPQAPQQIILDLDATDDPLHGNQEGRFFHGYYGHYCYLPLYIFCGEFLLGARLRPSNIDASAGSVEELERVVKQIRASVARGGHPGASRLGVLPRAADGLV